MSFYKTSIRMLATIPFSTRLLTITNTIVKYLVFSLNYMCIAIDYLLANTPFRGSLFAILFLLGFFIHVNLRIKNKEIRDHKKELVYVPNLEKLIWIVVMLVLISFICGITLITLTIYYTKPINPVSIALLVIAAIVELFIFLYYDVSVYYMYKDIVVQNKSFANHHIGYSTI